MQELHDLSAAELNTLYAQGRLSGARGNIKDCMSAGNPCILDQRLRDGRKHLPDRFAVLLPERCRAAPSVDHSLIALHGRKYSSGRLTRHSYRGTASRGENYHLGHSPNLFRLANSSSE